MMKMFTHVCVTQWLQKSFESWVSPPFMLTPIWITDHVRGWIQNSRPYVLVKEFEIICASIWFIFEGNNMSSLMSNINQAKHSIHFIIALQYPNSKLCLTFCIDTIYEFRPRVQDHSPYLQKMCTLIYFFINETAKPHILSDRKLYIIPGLLRDSKPQIILINETVISYIENTKWSPYLLRVVSPRVIFINESVMAHI